MRSFIAVLTLATAALGSPSAAQNVKAGIEAWQQGDHQKAIAIWRPLAEKGDADAAFNLGQAYRLGRGVATDLAVAQTWLERAARKDHLDAQATLGLLLFQNGNRTAGLRWLRQAAERGEPRAQLIYGTALFNGDGVERDLLLAYGYVHKSAAQGLAPAKETLAEMDAILPADQRRKALAAASGKSAPPTAAAKPAPRPPSPAPAIPAAALSTAWRIQLGAFSQRSSAEVLYKRLSSSAPVAGRQLFLVPAGNITRLQVGPFPTREAATAACSALKAKGQPCFPVAAK